MSTLQSTFGWAIVLGLVVASASPANGQNSAACGPYIQRGDCCAILAPTRVSPLDLQLRPYYVPRTPAWGPHGYRYHLKETVPFCGCDAPCEEPSEGECLPHGSPYPPEAAYGLDPGEFEPLGQIPNDSLLGGVVATPAR